MTKWKEGSTLGPYRIIEQIGMGGMATVYKAYQPSMERYVALKILPERYSEDPRFTERFTREARTIARLEHRHILPVYEFGEENGTTYLVMRYLDGGTLRDILKQGRLQLSDVAELMSQIASALDYAHRQNVIHRDVKPANILVDREGTAYLTDFGIAKVLEDAPGVTGTGATIGTPNYMSPEQALGKGGVDARTDIYALGVILYEMLVGQAPFWADTPMAIALAHIHDPLPMPRAIQPNLPESLERVLLKALAKAPEDRYQTAAEMGAAIRQAVQEAVQDPTTPAMLAAFDADTVNLGDTLAGLEAVTYDVYASPAAHHQPKPSTKTTRSIPLPAIIVGGVIAIGIVIVGLLAMLGALGGDPPVPTAIADAPTTEPTTQQIAAPATDEPTPTPTESPTATPEPQIYDDFENTIFDGSVNTTRWIGREGNSNCQFTQSEGVLAIFTEPSTVQEGCNITSIDSVDQPISKLRSITAQMRADGNHQGEVAFVLIRITIQAPGSPDVVWLADCGMRITASDLQGHFVLGRLGSLGVPKSFPLAFDEWNTIEMTFNPDTLEVGCNANGNNIGSDVSEGAASDQFFRIHLAGIRSPNMSGAAFIDEFDFELGE